MAPPALLQAIHQDPTDRRAKQVYADALQAQGHPRGRFIALQLDGSPGAMAQARTLFRSQRAAILGQALAKSLAHVEMREGFPHSAVLKSVRDDALWHAALASDVLPTLARIRKGKASRARLIEMLTRSHTPHLVDIEVFDPTVLRAVLDRGPPRTVRRSRFQTLPEPDMLTELAHHTSFEQWSELVLAIPGNASEQQISERLREIPRILRARGLVRVRRLWLASRTGQLIAPPLYPLLVETGLDALTVGNDDPGSRGYLRVERTTDGLGLRATGVLVGWVSMQIASWSFDGPVRVELGEDTLWPGLREKARVSLATHTNVHVADLADPSIPS